MFSNLQYIHRFFVTKGCLTGTSLDPSLCFLAPPTAFSTAAMTCSFIPLVPWVLKDSVMKFVTRYWECGFSYRVFGGSPKTAPGAGALPGFS